MASTSPGPATRGRVAGFCVVLLCVALTLVTPTAADAATLWPVGVNAASGAQAGAQAFPAPANVTASCGLLTATVSWQSVPHAASYSVYQNGVLVATNVAGTSWTSLALGLGTYSYTVRAYVGTNWVSAQSTASNSITIVLVALVLVCG